MFLNAVQFLNALLLVMYFCYRRSLYHNCIKYLPEGVFANLKNLEDL